MNKNSLGIRILSFFLTAACVITLVTVRRSVQASDSNTVYTENFDSIADGKLPDGWTVSDALKKSGGKAEVKDKKLVISSDNEALGKVLLPSKLSEYGNCSFEAEISFTKVTNDSRWCSLVVRQQSSESDFYQMCIRKTTTSSNGIEFAVHSASGWNVLDTAPAEENAGLNKVHKVKIEIYNSNVYEYFDGALVLESDSLSMQNKIFEKGSLGIIASNATITVDNITVSKLDSNPKKQEISTEKNTYYADFDQIYTTIISAPTVVVEPYSYDALIYWMNCNPKPQNMILNINDSMQVTDSTGNTVIGSVKDITEAIRERVVIVYNVKTETQAEGIKNFIKENALADCLIMSENQELVKSVRKSQKKIGGAIDFTGISTENVTAKTLDDIIYATNESSARIALIPESIATKKNVEYLQNRLITVWVEECAETDAMLHNSIQSGANGIITDTPEALYTAYRFYNNDISVLCRTPFVIGHRGLPSKAPENSLESAKEANKAGADCIELDIRLSKDGEVWIYHDNDLNVTTNSSGTVNSKTSEQLKKVSIIKSSSYGTFKSYPKVSLVRLEDYFIEFKNDDVMFFVEIKENAPKLISETARLINDYNMWNRCIMITFLPDAITAFQKAVPGMSCGYLMANPNGKNNEQRVRNVLNMCNPYKATFNASGISDRNQIKSLMARGITCWPWTYGSGNTAGAYLLGVGGITTDTADLASDIARDIIIDGKYEYTVNPGDSLTYNPTVTTRTGTYDFNAKYSDGTQRTAPELVIIDGNDFIEVNGNTITAKKDGTAHLMYRLVTSSDPKNAPNMNTEFSLYTQVITINVNSETSGDTDLPTKAPDKAVNGNKTAIITVSVIAAVLVIGAAVFIFFKGKSGNKKN